MLIGIHGARVWAINPSEPMTRNIIIRIISEKITADVMPLPRSPRWRLNRKNMERIPNSIPEKNKPPIPVAPEEPRCRNQHPIGIPAFRKCEFSTSTAIRIAPEPRKKIMALL
jgi:hypothetical protein